MRTTPSLFIVTAVAAACLGGCTSQIGWSGISERAGQAVDSVKDPFVAPRKFQYLRCPDLTARLAGAQAHEQELRNLMDRSGAGLGGSAINLTVYQPDLQSALSDIQQLKDMQVEKNCPPPPAPKVEVTSDADAKKKGKTGKTGNGKTGNGKTGSDKTGSDKTGSDKTGNDKTGNDGTGGDRTGSASSGTDERQ